MPVGNPMLKRFLITLISLSVLYVSCTDSTAGEIETMIVNGVPWYDNSGNIVNSHAPCIVEDNGKYWLFGEYKSDTTNSFPGFGCYSSEDLVHWEFERVVLPVQKEGILGPDRVGERVKVMKCPLTGEYVMFMHTDNLSYTDPCIAYATCDVINGDYELQGPLLYEGGPIRKWDMGTFQDSDGKGYLLIHHGVIYRLSEDYRSAESLVLPSLEGSGESPAMFFKDGLYYLMYSHLTSWERNDNYYYTSENVEGPWTLRGTFCPEGTLTYNSQCSFVFMIQTETGPVPMYMGDRWSYPCQSSCATAVWLPIKVDGTSIFIPEYWQAWNPRTMSPIDMEEYGTFSEASPLSDEACALIEYDFHGKRIALKGVSGVTGGYANISITNDSGEEVVSAKIDFYSLVPASGVLYLSPELSEGEYHVAVSSADEHPVWFDKSGKRYGSQGYDFNVSGFIVY